MPYFIILQAIATTGYIQIKPILQMLQAIIVNPILCSIPAHIICHNFFILGGQIRPSSLAVVGSWANNQLACIHADVADGFHGADDPSTMSYEESEIKKTMLESSRQKIVLADSSKFCGCSSFQF